MGWTHRVSGPNFFLVMESGELEIQLNGEAKLVPAGLTLGGLVADHGLDPRVVLVELNGQALKSGQWTEQVLQAGDQVELVRIVAGG